MTLDAKAMKVLFGHNLRTLRKRPGCEMTQSDLAEATGLDRTEIGLLERGQRMPRGDTLYKLVTVLGVSFERLFEGSCWNESARRFEPGPTPGRAEEALLRTIGCRLSAAEPGATVILFGSRGRSDAKPNSDFDLLVIRPTEVKKRAAESASLRRDLRGLGIAVDLILVGAAEADEVRHSQASVIHAAIHEGRILVQGDFIVNAEGS